MNFTTRTMLIFFASLLLVACRAQPAEPTEDDDTEVVEETAAAEDASEENGEEGSEEAAAESGSDVIEVEHRLETATDRTLRLQRPEAARSSQGAQLRLREPGQSMGANSVRGTDLRGDAPLLEATQRGSNGEVMNIRDAIRANPNLVIENMETVESE